MIMKKERGDTIVEVLIAMAVVSMILGGAYAAVNRSSIYTRTAQERGEALQLLQGQVERLKSASTASIFDSTTAANPFCIDDSNGRVDLTGALPASANDDPYSSTVYPPACKKSPQGGVEYNFAISRVGSNGFSLFARWDGLSNIKQEVRIEYRYYQ